MRYSAPRYASRTYLSSVPGWGRVGSCITLDDILPVLVEPVEQAAVRQNTHGVFALEHEHTLLQDAKGISDVVESPFRNSLE
jgi:hypothetical protein